MGSYSMSLSKGRRRLKLLVDSVREKTAFNHKETKRENNPYKDRRREQ